MPSAIIHTITIQLFASKNENGQPPSDLQAMRRRCFKESLRKTRKKKTVKIIALPVIFQAGNKLEALHAAMPMRSMFAPAMIHTLPASIKSIDWFTRNFIGDRFNIKDNTNRVQNQRECSLCNPVRPGLQYYLLRGFSQYSLGVIPHAA